MNQNVKVGLIILIIILIVSFVIALVLTSSTSFEGLSLPTSGGTKQSVALIKVEGPITIQEEASLFSAGGASSEDIVDQIERAAEDDNIKAVYFMINSPGGTVVASEEIANAIKKLDKPTVAFIREVGASGGYWVASATDHIIADPYCITGSIGVLSVYLNYADLLTRYNISYVELKGGKYKDIGSPYRKATSEEKALLQQKIDMIHQAFIMEIAQNRNMPYQQAREVSTGIFYLGTEAKQLGLVDELGSKDDVENYLKELLNATEIDYIQYVQPPTFLETLAGVMSESFFYIGKGVAAGFAEIEKNRFLDPRIIA